MNRLDDLKNTLDRHAADLDGSTLDAHSRRTSLEGRIAVHRRRRNAARGGAAGLAALALTAVVLVPQLGDDAAERETAPVDRSVLGLEAPAAIKSGDGWTYTYSSAESSEESGLTVDLAESDRPRLLSWATAGDDQDVTLTSDGDSPWYSRAGDFGDHYVLPAGFVGRVSVEAAEGGVALAVYEVDVTRAPEGLGDPASDMFLRSDVPSMTSEGSLIADVGVTETSIELTSPSEADLALVAVCEGLPAGVKYNVSLDGEFLRGGRDCGGPGFDPVSGGHSSFEVPARGTLRIWASRTIDGPAIDPSEAPDVRLGVAAYSTDTVDVSGMDVERVIERAGHLWELDSTEPIAPGETVDVSSRASRQPVLVTSVVRVAKGRYYGFGLTTDPVLPDSPAWSGLVGQGLATMGDLILPTGTTSVTVARQDRPSVTDPISHELVFYRLVD